MKNSLHIQNSKMGISLIAVLMFMLAATTASIVVFKWIGSENFTSGSRLKMSEAEAATNSGLNAVQAWLENRAPDAGVLLSEYLAQTINPQTKERNPIRIDNLLGTVGGSKEQEYKVYLVGVDVNARPFKFKFLSVGTARDGSENRQIAIFGVDGLYKMSLPGESQIEPGPFNQAFWGKLAKATDGTEFSSAVINGDYEGNQPSVTGSLIVTGNMNLQGTTNMACGTESNGDVYVKGELKTEGDIKFCGNAYFGSIRTNEGVRGTFEKDLYIGGTGNIGGGNNLMDIKNDYIVKGNLTIRKGDLKTGPTASLTIGGDLAFLDKAGKIEHDNGRTTTVGGTTWLPSGEANNNSNLILNNNANKKLYTGKIWCENDGSKNGGGYYEFSKDKNPNGKIRSKGELYCGIKTGNACPEPHPPHQANCTMPDEVSEHVALANELTELANRITPANIVEDPIQAMNVTGWMSKAREFPKLCAQNGYMIPGTGNPSANANSVDNTVSLESNIFNEDEFAYNLNKCYAALKTSGKLEKGYLPIIINNNEQKNLRGPFDGNFFFIFIGGNKYEGGKSKGFGIGSTTVNGKIMIYFPNSKNGGTNTAFDDGEALTKASCVAKEKNAMKDLGLQECPEIYNLFIFSERDLGTLNNFSGITGSLFMANGTKIKQIQGEVDIQFNEELYNSLSTAGILELTEAGKKLQNNPPKTYEIVDYRYTPLGPRLKVSLESRYTSIEKQDYLNVSNLEPAVLVMPRVVYLPSNADLNTSQDHKVDNYFSVLYLNGQKDPNNRNNANWRSTRGRTECRKMTDNYPVDWNDRKKGDDYKCAFTTTGINPVQKDDFFVRIVSELGASKVGFASPGSLINEESNGCATVWLQYQAGIDPYLECNPAIVPPSPMPQGWSISPSNALGSITVSESKPFSFKICADNTALGSINLEMTAFGNCLPGQYQNHIVRRESTRKSNITRVRNPELNNIPDCNVINSNPQKNGPKWGNFEIYSAVAECQGESAPYTYSCKGDNNYYVQIQANNVPEQCELLPVGNTNRTPNDPGVEASGNISIPADIKRKSYALKFDNTDGFNITLTPQNTANASCIIREGAGADCNAPNNQLQPVQCSGSSCADVTIYGGITYSVAITGAGGRALINCDNNLVCNFNTTGTAGTLSVTSHANRANRLFALRTLPNLNISCDVRSGAEMAVGQAAFTSAGEIETMLMQAPLSVNNNQGRCLNPQTVYKVKGNNLDRDIINWVPNAVYAGYEIWAYVICDPGSEISGTNEAPCNGTFAVVNETQPSITCVWNNGNANYNVGDSASATVAVKNGSTKTCHAPTVSSSNFSGSTTAGSWNRIGTPNSSPGTVSTYTITSNPLTLAETDRSVTVRSQCADSAPTATCSGKTVEAASSSSSAPTVSCKLRDRNNQEVNSLTVTQGENINAPNVTCSNGNASNKVFNTSGTAGLPSNAISNWPNNNGNAYYTSSQAPGSYTISLSSVVCNGSAPTNLPATCGTITVQKPTCSRSGDYAPGASIPVPTYNCGAASASNAKFNITGANNDNNITSNLDWNNTPPAAHSFYNPGNGRAIYMYQVSCDGHELGYGSSTQKEGIPCGSINILQAGSSSSNNCNSWDPANGTLPVGCINVTVSKTCGMNCSSANCSISPCDGNGPCTATNDNPNMGTTFNSGTNYTVSGTITAYNCY